MTQSRCPWAKDEYDILYHDTQWGKPVHNDALLFEFLILEGMQAGLTWNLILKRREGMRQTFDGFDPVKIAQYTTTRKEELLQNPSIIRNRRKVEALVYNAQAFLEVQQEYGSFSDYLWNFTQHKQIVNAWETVEQVPVSTSLSETISKDLRKRGFRFVGPTIIYSYMQAIGMVNDHLISCKEYHHCQLPAKG